MGPRPISFDETAVVDSGNLSVLVAVHNEERTIDVVYGSRFLVSRAAPVSYFSHRIANAVLTFISNWQRILDYFAAHNYVVLGKYLRADSENVKPVV